MSRSASSPKKISSTEEKFDDKLVELDEQYVNLINEYHDYYDETKDKTLTLTIYINLMIKQFKNTYANDCRENFFNPDEAADPEKVVPKTYDYFLANLQIFDEIDYFLAHYTTDKKDFCTNFIEDNILLQLINKHKTILDPFYNNFPEDIQERIALNHVFFSIQAKFFVKNINKQCSNYIEHLIKQRNKPSTSGGKSKKRRRRTRRTKKRYIKKYSD